MTTENEPIDQGELLLLAVTRMHRLQLELLGRLETPLTLRQYRILQRVDQGHTSLSSLSRIAFRSLPSMSESVDLLMRRGLLSRRVSQVDRRAAELSLTPDGQKAFHAGTSCLQNIADDFFSEFPPSRRGAVEKVSQRMFSYAGERMGQLTREG